MDRSQAYAVLSKELTFFAGRPWRDLAIEVGSSKEIEVQVEHEICYLKLNIDWADEEKNRIKISGCLNGPSWWRLERLEERIFVKRPL